MVRRILVVRDRMFELRSSRRAARIVASVLVSSLAMGTVAIDNSAAERLAGAPARPSVEAVPPPTCLTAPLALAKVSPDGTYHAIDTWSYQIGGDESWAGPLISYAWSYDHCIFVGTGYDPITDAPVQSGVSISVSGNVFHTGANTLTVSSSDGYQARRFHDYDNGLDYTLPRHLYAKLDVDGGPGLPMGAHPVGPTVFDHDTLEVGRIAAAVDLTTCQHDLTASGSSCSYTVTIPDGTPAFVGYLSFQVKQGQTDRPDGVGNDRLVEITLDPTNRWTPSSIPAVTFPISYDGSALPAPTVGITWHASGTPGEFDFTANATAAYPLSITNYDWDFGGGTATPSNGSASEHVGWTGEAASRTVAVTVTDSSGQKTTATATVLPSLSITQAVTSPAAVEALSPASMLVSVSNDGPSTISNVVPAMALGPSGVVTVTDPPVPASASIPPGGVQVFSVPFNALASGNASGTIDASGTAAGDTVNAQQRSRTFTIGNPGLEIQLDGSVVQVGQAFTVKMTVTNPGTDEVDNLVWGDPTGLSTAPADNPPLPASNIDYQSGPDLALPTTLASKQTMALLYRFNAPTVGTSVVLASVTGTTATDSTVVNGKAAMTIVVAGEWSKDERDRLAVAGINNGLGVIADQLTTYDSLLRGQVTTAFGFDDPTAAQVTSLQQAGLERPSMVTLLPGLLVSGKDQAIALLGGIAEGYAKGMDTFGVEGGQTLANLYSSIFDADHRQRTAAAIWEYAQTVPQATVGNIGYLGVALQAPFTVEGLKAIYNANTSLAGNVATAVGEAFVGTPALLASYAHQYSTDPVGAMGNLGNFGGGTAWTGFISGATAVVGEVGLTGVGALGAKVIPKGLSVFTRGGAVEAPLADTVDIATAGASDARATEAMVQRTQQAQQVIDNYQALPEGMVLDVATVTGKGGILASDAEAIQSTLESANTKFGTEFELAMRTSEPLSAGIDGIAKPEWVKPKAISVLDQMMGADPTRAGKVGLFEPVPLDPQVVAKLDAANPGFAAKYADRLQTQQKLWAEWQKPDSPLRILTEAGERYKDTGGITVLNARPGNPVPYGLKYLEQLDEPAFQAAHRIDPSDVAGIKHDILKLKNIDTFKAAPVATISESGTVYIDEALSGKSFVSDADIQSIRPRNGVWPKGVSRGQVETYFKAELQKLDRFPFHGWSDSAIDLPSDYYSAAIPFQLGNADPTMAVQAANLVAGRLQSLENIAIAKAAQLTAIGDTEAAANVLAPFEKLEEFKDPSTGLYSSAKLLKRYPPGEKTINFTAGDIRVGYGTGGH